MQLRGKIGFPNTKTDCQDFKISTSDFYESVRDFCWCRAPRTNMMSTTAATCLVNQHCLYQLLMKNPTIAKEVFTSKPRVW